MNEQDLEKLLMGLESPSPPASLLGRCLQTIPVGASATPPRLSISKGKQMTYKFALGLLLFGAVSLWTIHPPSRNGTSFPSDFVFAQAVAATQQVPFYHVKSRSMGFNLDGGDDGKTWYSSRWTSEETWFDAEQGEYSQSGGPTSAAGQQLWLPNGAAYVRVGDHLKITQFPPQNWRDNVHSTLGRLLNLSTSARGFNDAVDPKPEAKKAGQWQGRPAAIFTFVARPSPKYAAKGAPTVRTIFYVDAATRRCLTEQQYAQLPNGNNSLVNQFDYDYVQRPDRTCFDPQRIEAGVSKTDHAVYAVGGPPVNIEPDEAGLTAPGR